MRKLFRQLPMVSLATLLLVTTSFLGPLSLARADEGEEPAWIVSHQVEGNLIVTPDSSLSQWAQAHHGHADSLDGVEMELMSVHNGTYIVFLIERSFNLSIGMASIGIFFNGTAFDSGDAVWGWASGQVNSTDSEVSSSGELNGEELMVVFGRPLVPALNSSVHLGVGQLYDESVKTTSWNNDTAPTSLNYEDLPVMGLELLPPIDLFPKAPIIYSAVILVATLGFVLIEARRYRD